MAVNNDDKTTKKAVMGPDTGKKFSSDNQPPAEHKKAGWKELREQRLLTQNLLKALLDENGIPTTVGEDFFKSLVTNAKGGNPKAIDVIINALEEQKTIQEVRLPKIGKDLEDETYT